MIGFEQLQDLVRVAAVPGLFRQADLRDVRPVLAFVLGLLLGCLAAAELLLGGEVGLVFVLNQSLVQRGLLGGQLGLAQPLGLGVFQVALGDCKLVRELAAVLLRRDDQVLVRGEVEHQGHDNGDRRHEGRRESDEDGPMLFVGVQPAAGEGGTRAGNRLRARRARRGIRRGVGRPSRRGSLLGRRGVTRGPVARSARAEVAVVSMGRFGAIRPLRPRFVRVTRGTAARRFLVVLQVLVILAVLLILPALVVLVVGRELGRVGGVVFGMMAFLVPVMLAIVPMGPRRVLGLVLRLLFVVIVLLVLLRRVVRAGVVIGLVWLSSVPGMARHGSSLLENCGGVLSPETESMERAIFSSVERNLFRSADNEAAIPIFRKICH